QEEIPNVQKESLLSAFDKAADFICLQRESHGFISNHLAGIALGLLNAAAILNNKKYLNKSNEIIEKILKHQSKEGWYREYEGADPGYETLGISYLAKYWKSTHSAELLKSLEKSLNYLIYFVHPDGTLGGEYGSRNTELYYPSGIEALSDYLPQSEYIANKMIIGIKEERLSLPLTTDIFNFIPLLISYVEAYNELNHNVSKSSGNIKLNNFKYFDESKIAVWTNDKHKIIIGISKGGIIRCYKNNGNMLYSDCGYVARLENGSKISSQFIDYNIDCNVTSRGCKLERYFSYVSEHQMSPTTFILFEIFMLLAGRYIKIGNWIKNLLANRLIRYKKTAPLSIVRSIKIFETKLVIEDHLKIKKKNIIKELIRKSKFSTIFMGSSRYFNPQELFQDDERIDGQELKFLNGQRFIKLVKEVTLD
ncbi:MAG: hypothetical protein KAJ79_01815, partial [Candidatus Omnitrophica bacterium]|nr:hypothetical protein [Candidatus Omnitrophota bacterium]